MQKTGVLIGAMLFGVSLSAGDAIAGDAARGEQVFKRCEACHTLDAGGANTNGPNLHGLFGRTAGTFEGYAEFSAAMTGSGVVWTAETLDQFLAKPKQLIPDNTMSFTALRNASQREDLIAYLEQATK